MSSGWFGREPTWDEQSLGERVGTVIAIGFGLAVHAAPFVLVVILIAALR